MKFFIKWFIGIVMMLIVAGPVAANGAPIKIFLNYLPEYSNYGSNDATGVALVSIGEAWVDLEVDGLPQLNGQSYEAWLVEAETSTMISLGKFNSDSTGQVKYHAEFEQIPELDYRYFVISVETDPDPGPEADARRTIAGVFPNAEVVVVSGTPTPTLVPGITPTPAPPPTLPVTGDLKSKILNLGLLIMGLGLSIAGLVLWRNKHLSQ
ncbi:MAG: hypothetical protein HC875_00195 [Anaerolineales bacterium]|nr:hypothetical protein [Anaerolineales bacterium]